MSILGKLSSALLHGLAKYMYLACQYIVHDHIFTEARLFKTRYQSNFSSGSNRTIACLNYNYNY